MNSVIGIALLLSGTGQGAGLAFQGIWLSSLGEVVSLSETQKLGGLLITDLDLPVGGLRQIGNSIQERKTPLDLLFLKHSLMGLKG